MRYQVDIHNLTDTERKARTDWFTKNKIGWKVRYMPVNNKSPYTSPYRYCLDIDTSDDDTIISVFRLKFIGAVIECITVESVLAECNGLVKSMVINLEKLGNV